MKKSDLFFNVLRLPVDSLMLILAGLVTYFLRTEILSSFRPVLFEFNLPLSKFLYLAVPVSFIFIASYAFSGLYSIKTRIRIFEELSKVIFASSAAILAVIIYIFLRQELFDSRFLILGGWFFGIIFVFIGRFIIRYVQAVAVAKYDFGAHKIIIIGKSNAISALVSIMAEDLSLGYRIVEAVDSPDIERLRVLIEKYQIDEVLLAQNDYPQNQISEVVNLCHEHYIIFKLIPTGSNLLASNFDIDIFEGLPIIEIKRTNLDGWGKVIKRVIDIVGSLAGLIILSPLFGLLALMIKWETEGPIFARLGRVSGRKEFYLLKFRSMIENAEELKPLLASFNERSDGPLFKMRNDPRVTNIGRLMRRIRIDELPQLINVLKGEMSLVGPRPHQPDEIALYRRHQKKVLAVKAGATGLAQTSGSSDLNFEQEVTLDSFYIDNWSLWLDTKIILKTVLKMFFDRSAV
ncbi:MAG: hypothetical protein A3B91_01610 [Candidatus Yanofskybacteria bacterium RIFCSPHIGHO2_02_FULL_41_29]|uniref:Bacterial sugar transferase domain-containing protein n=1 Tax=Candidatus Yanofskybacteria bacterium RIFCSPHIGHO2_01_FULL_41_53 TaxID=1802663 RepID=A0A1F8EHQ3_9BACT|nr:MAG: hypothetical protein A2650_00840 [Candidatus Yanofskybacteria bacterium RIFCSPHIGHO2_01_FULL_41_53]OGN12080.1 MAG: hypothetical protein A3B91_01610 [Candidatus Yanofskybacteria bacterium RIFCSPHIGHO2_02_FULL_41_29]OGN17806.1 MAG: hypothetical protein A3F48_01925 [Candidatus Yanofskybacteria bacterium RIFCSPHIGHO2_12_FULL_41_9]OGN22349.1 MAG: hypothetical protein A2916_04960 [Candidatus Yanofskybacteria bacterium RIFCSPLOWO2_01_FULL_41_67]OGN35349.1 MAG: hypothetical protein A3F98_00020 